MTASATAGNATASPEGTGPGGRAALLVLVLDRSVEDPNGTTARNPCSRLQEAANELLQQVSTQDLGSLPIDTAIVSYGFGADGQPDVRTTFAGPLAGRTIVRNAELAAGPIRIEESEEPMSNGAGGVIMIRKKSPIYMDVEPAAAVPPQAAFAAWAEIVLQWCGQNPTGVPPIVLHLTRAGHAAADVAAAADLLSAVSSPGGPVLLHHLVATEAPHKSLAYPDGDADIEAEGLRAAWQASSNLSGWEELRAAKRRSIGAGSRGFVVNGKFDVLGEELSNALAPASS